MLSLPWLESLGGIVHAADAAKEPRRLLLVCLPLGIYRDSFVPKQPGTSYELPEYLAPLADLRDCFTVVSGLEHPGVNGGHSAQPRIFTGVPSSERNRRSLDNLTVWVGGQKAEVLYAGSHGTYAGLDQLNVKVSRTGIEAGESGVVISVEGRFTNVTTVNLR